MLVTVASRVGPNVRLLTLRVHNLMLFCKRLESELWFILQPDYFVGKIKSIIVQPKTEPILAFLTAR